MTLTFYKLPGVDHGNHSIVPCGDGSPAGVYTDFAFHATPLSTNHIIFVQGGGACESKENCQKELAIEPAKFSSRYFPSSIHGDTILSSDPSINPEAHSYVKWLIPYCSQDAYLGSGNGTVAGLERAGSLHIQSFLAFFQGAVQDLVINQLVLAGTSAGAMGLANHMDQVRSVSQKLQVAQLKTILDSSQFSDTQERDYSLLTSEYVDQNMHPLCSVIDDRNNAVSNLPCCLSIHCLLRHPGGLLSRAGSIDL